FDAIGAGWLANEVPPTQLIAYSLPGGVFIFGPIAFAVLFLSDGEMVARMTATHWIAVIVGIEISMFFSKSTDPLTYLAIPLYFVPIILFYYALLHLMGQPVK